MRSWSAFELQVADDLAELRDAHLAEVCDVEVVPLAGGLELLHLVEFGDGRARHVDLGPTAWRVRFRCALVWAKSGAWGKGYLGEAVARAGSRAELIRSAGPGVGTHGA